MNKTPLLKPIQIRQANKPDCEAIARIYNQAIVDRNCTFDDQRISPRRYYGFLRSPKGASMLVAESEDRVLGWTSIRPISDRRAYRFTCLGSLFVARRFRNIGVGEILKMAQLNEAVRQGYHSIIAEVLATNESGLSLNLRFGYKIVGEICEAGFRDGKWIGLIVMQNILPKKALRFPKATPGKAEN